MKYVKVKDLGQIITGNTPPTTDESYYGDFMPFIKATDIQLNSRFTYITEQCYSEKSYNKYKANLVPKGSTCIVTIGSIGKKMTQAHTDLFVNQAINAILPNERYDKDYVYYVTRYAVLPQLKIYDSGTTSGRENISKSSFSNIRLFVEDNIINQIKIASILSAYDNFIENNNKRIRLLEQMAENLYKEWFVRFRFPGHENAEFENGLPKGWKKGKLRDLAIEVGKSEKAYNRDKYNHYLPIDKLPMKSMALQEEDSIDNAESSLRSFKRGDILFGAMRPYLYKVIIAPFAGLTRSTCFVINARESVYSNYLYLLMFHKSTVDYASTVAVGSTMPYDRWNDLARMNIIIPNSEIASKFNRIIAPILHRIIDNYQMNTNLSRQRDLLLPRLMSGKLEVNV